MIDFWKEYTEEECGKMMVKLINQVGVVHHYFGRLESYLSKKQDQSRDSLSSDVETGASSNASMSAKSEK